VTTSGLTWPETSSSPRPGRALGRHGAAVAVADVDLDAARQVTDEIVAAGGRAIAVETDVSQSSAVQALVDRTISEFGDITILVNHAGMGASMPIDELTEERWDKAMGVSLRGTFLCIRAVVPSMRRAGGGRIVNTTSRAAYRAGVGAGLRGVAAYAANKAGIAGLSVAIELGPSNITVNCIAPGLMRESGNFRELGMDHPPTAEERQASAEREGQVLPPEPGDPEDVAGAMLYLVGPYGRRVTGTVMHVNGGAYFPA
jgi:NAD(P)-dependent dehydrogenase (short-subunit alcohol dehydrogenase family)